MNRARLLEILGHVWAIFGLYWVVAGAKSKAAQTREPHLYRLIRLGILATVFLLLFWSRASIGILGRRFLPDLPVISYGGFVAAVAGLVVAIWARIHLGQYWSDKVVLKVDHQLIRNGPYAHMRHPIYSGVLLAILGTALVLGEWRGLLAFIILLVNYSIKAKKEEQILATEFGPAFHEQQQRTGFLLPRFHWRDW
jgi:protein-S-isoprenylcysteine O-methyltransferase Ste14